MISYAAIPIHGLRAQDLATAPPPPQALAPLLSAIRHRVLVAHVAGVERAFLHAHLVPAASVSVTGSAAAPPQDARGSEELGRHDRRVLPVDVDGAVHLDHRAGREPAVDVVDDPHELVAAELL